MTSGHVQVAEEREASSSLSGELSKARAALQKAQTEVARQRWGLSTLAASHASPCAFPLTDSPPCLRHQLRLSVRQPSLSGTCMPRDMLLQLGALEDVP